MPRFRILCPHHAEVEEVEVPDSYAGKGFGESHTIFEGHIPCNPGRGAGDVARVLFLRVHFAAEAEPWVERLEKVASD